MKAWFLKHKEFAIFFICMIGVFLFHLCSYNRFGYYVDEIGSMYDAYCISNFGVDRWLQSYPIHFLNYGDGQSAIFVYILSFLFQLFGYEKWVIRLVPLFFHIMTIYFIGKWMGLYDKKLEKYGYIFSSILPVFYLLFQFGLESHFMLSFSAAFLYFLCKGIKTQKSIDFLISGIFAGLTFYTYVLSYIGIPIFLILFGIYLWKTKKISIKQILIFFLPVLCLGFPLLIVQIINILNLESFTLLGITFPKFLIYRGNELGFSKFFSNLYETFIHTNFYENTVHLCIPTFGNIYYISIPFLMIGFISHCKKMKENEISAACIIWAISFYILAGLLQEDGSLTNTRLNALYLTKIPFLIEGIKISLYALKKGKKWLNLGIVISFSICFIGFMSFYFTKYDLNQQSTLFLETYEDLPELEGTVYVPENYCYFLWSKKINPYDFNINENGYLSYQNYRIGYQNLDTHSYYVISKEDNISQDTLNQFGYTNIKELKHFYIYKFQNF